ncbi:hypothetical protein L484_003580 [Morus notabilis]|uniref:Uncharacterized protein n=1 Tax=Morus notabilis TaxID=981085 RepID=W9RQF0_9ROSA|nr:hypothetical protein L484_003580 [Morus notabilis]
MSLPYSYSPISPTIKPPISFEIASVELDKLVGGPKLILGVVVENPQQVFEQHHLASHRNATVVLIFVRVAAFSAAGFVDQLLKQRGLHDLGANEVPPPSLPDVNGAKNDVVVFVLRQEVRLRRSWNSWRCG